MVMKFEQTEASSVRLLKQMASACPVLEAFGASHTGQEVSHPRYEGFRLKILGFQKQHY